jgi:hypothetical protein
MSPITDNLNKLRAFDALSTEAEDGYTGPPLPLPELSPERKREMEEAFFARRLEEEKAHEAQKRANWRRGAKTRAANRRVAKAAARKAAKTAQPSATPAANVTNT